MALIHAACDFLRMVSHGILESHMQKVFGSKEAMGKHVSRISGVRFYNMGCSKPKVQTGNV